MKLQTVDSLKMKTKTALVCLGVVGRASFPFLLVLVLLGVWAETFRPGLVFNQLAPQFLAVLLVVSGLLSLLLGERRGSGWRRLVFVVVGLLLTVMVWRLSAFYFGSLSSVDRNTMIAAAVGVTLLTILTSLSAGWRPGTKKEK